MYYNNYLLMAVGRGFGPPIKIDAYTSLAMRGCFARVCVEIDLNKLLVGQFTIRVSMMVIRKHTRFIRLLVDDGNMHEWVYTVIYTSPSATGRDSMERAVHFHDTNSKPWMLVRDFIDYLGKDEKHGGTFCWSRDMKFKQHLDRCELMDLSYKGSSFTYARKIHGSITTFVWLDKAVTITEWRVIFPETSVISLPWTYLNHNPIMVRLTGIITEKKD